jgi:response regulator of citrate/malate metabolism
VITVLVVEDNLTAGEALVEYVERVPGFAVVGHVRTGAEALQRMSNDRVDLVMMDIYLPDMSGLDVLRRMRWAGNLADVVAVTRARDLSVVRASVSLGAVHYLLKPFTFATIRQRLERYQAYRSWLDEDERLLAQDEIDQLLRGPGGIGGDDLPKGITPESLRVVVSALEQAGPDTGASAVEVADSSGTSRVTARRYLEYLHTRGIVVRGARYGGAGRPEVEYRLRPSDHGGSRERQEPRVDEDRPL